MPFFPNSARRAPFGAVVPALLLSFAALGCQTAEPGILSPFVTGSLGLNLPPEPPPPRVDRVSLAFTSFLPDGQVNVWLYVQGANIDPKSRVLVDGEDQPTMPHKAMNNDFMGVKPEVLAFPVFDYMALIAGPGPRAGGSSINVAIRDGQGRQTDAVEYVLPSDPFTLDSDGDDLPDVWETAGIDFDGPGGPCDFVDLPALGADPFRPDIFVEVDVMDGVKFPPDDDTWKATKAAFDAAPILNPRSKAGIGLHIDDSSRSTPVASALYVKFEGKPPSSSPSDELVWFYDVKAEHFDNASRGRIFHYCLWAKKLSGGGSGKSDVARNSAGTDFVGPGDDFVVTLDGFSSNYDSIRTRAETFMHELGHDLMQKHGGADHDQYTPQYHSVMNYSWQLRTGRDSEFRIKNPIDGDPFYYGSFAAEEDAAGNLPASFDRTRIDFSEGMSSEDFANWNALVYSGPRQNGQWGD